MSECAVMQELKVAREHERHIAKVLGRIHGSPHVDAALDLTRRIGNHWDGCNECQGLAVVEQMTDRQRVKEVYALARLAVSSLEPLKRRCAIYVGKPEDGGRQISDQCASSSQAWRSAWEKIEASREASHGN